MCFGYQRIEIQCKIFFTFAYICSPPLSPMVSLTLKCPFLTPSLLPTVKIQSKYFCKRPHSPSIPPPLWIFWRSCLTALLNDILQVRIVFIFHFVNANLFPPLSWEINSVEADDPSLVTASPDPPASDWSVCKLKISKSFAGIPKQFFIRDPKNVLLIRKPIEKLQIGIVQILCKEPLHLCTCHKKSLDLPHQTNSSINWKYQNSFREIHNSSG